LTDHLFVSSLQSRSAPGGAVDLVFAFSGESAEDYTTAQYFSAGAGNFQANYFREDLRRRGLIDVDPSAGPPLKHFPFYDDASVINDALWAFMTAFSRSYYASDAVVGGRQRDQGLGRRVQRRCRRLGVPCQDLRRRHARRCAHADGMFSLPIYLMPHNSPRPKYLSLLFFFFSFLGTYLIIYLSIGNHNRPT
jgi:hypothetical protein